MNKKYKYRLNLNIIPYIVKKKVFEKNIHENIKI